MALYRHKERGTLYRLIGFGKMQSKDWQRSFEATNGTGLGAGGHTSFGPVDMSEVAIYQGETDKALWVRPREEFEDGRFEFFAFQEGDRVLDWVNDKATVLRHDYASPAPNLYLRYDNPNFGGKGWPFFGDAPGHEIRLDLESLSHA